MDAKTRKRVERLEAAVKRLSEATGIEPCFSKTDGGYWSFYNSIMGVDTIGGMGYMCVFFMLPKEDSNSRIEISHTTDNPIKVEEALSEWSDITVN